MKKSELRKLIRECVLEEAAKTDPEITYKEAADFYTAYLKLFNQFFDKFNNNKHPAGLDLNKDSKLAKERNKVGKTLRTALEALGDFNAVLALRIK